MTIPSPTQQNRRAWLVCLSAGLFFFYEFIQLNVFDVINQSLRDSFHLNAAEVSWMSSTFVWANVLFLLPAGYILDRCRAHFVILGALSCCLIGTFGFGLTHSYAWASFFHALTGLGNACCFLSCVVLVTRWFPPTRQALVIGCIVTMAFLGGMAAHTPVTYLIESFGWRKSILMDGILGVFILIWIAVVVRDKYPVTTPSRSKEKSANKTVIPSAGKERDLLMLRRCLAKLDMAYFFSSLKSQMKQLPLTNKQIWLAGFYTACLNLPIMVLCALWGNGYLQTVHHLSNIAASNTMSVIFIGSIFGCPLVGWLSDRQGQRKPLMLIGAIATLLLLLCLLLTPKLSVFALSLIFLAIGLFTSTQIISYPLIAESTPAGHTGMATGMASMIVMGGGGLAQLLFGMAIAHHAGVMIRHPAIADFRYAMWIFPLTTIFALFSAYYLKETYCKPAHLGEPFGGHRETRRT